MCEGVGFCEWLPKHEPFLPLASHALRRSAGSSPARENGLRWQLTPLHAGAAGNDRHGVILLCPLGRTRLDNLLCAQARSLLPDEYTDRELPRSNSTIWRGS